MVVNRISMGYKPESQRERIFYLFRIAIMAVVLLCQPSTFAQTPKITVAKGTASISWPQTAYYYPLQSTTNLSGSNTWVNVAGAPNIAKVVGNNFVITQSTANAQQFFRLQSPAIPVFSFAVFYDGMLEFTWTPDMVINGCVHANGPICTGTSASLTFDGAVTTTSTITSPARDGSTPSWLSQGTTFNGPYITNLPAFLSPVGTNNPHVLIEIPPANEDPTSSLGQSRLYNQAQVVVIVTNSPSLPSRTDPAVYLALQTSYNGNVPGADPAKAIYFIDPASPDNLLTNPAVQLPFLSLTNKFTDKREYQTNMFVTQIDVRAYTNWLGTNANVASKFSNYTCPTILYVADQRNIGTNKLSVVRLVNGATLPYNGGLGFSVATPNPLYVKGNYNVTADGIHFAYTLRSTITNGSCVPAALLCDAITILSSSFNDSTSAGAAQNACADTTVGSTTVNAAIVTGNVPSTGTTANTFSGGVHNLMRMQEDWGNGSDNLILNTSIVVLYASQMATNQFRNPIGWNGVLNPYYTPPHRLWGYDPNFFDPAKLPPGTPVYTLP